MTPVNRNPVRLTEPDTLPAVEGAPKPLVPGMRWLLLTAAVLVLLAGFQLFVFTGRTGTFFAWTIANPLAAAFLGAGYWASMSIEALSGRQRVWANARIAVPAVFVFTVLTLAATLMHLGQFHLGGEFATGTRIVTVAWIAIYVLVPALMVIVLVVQARAAGADPPRSATLPAVHALLERDARRLRPAAAGYILLAVLQAIALARYPHEFGWESSSGIVYLIFLATMLLTGAVALARGTSPIDAEVVS